MEIEPIAMHMEINKYCSAFYISIFSKFTVELCFLNLYFISRIVIVPLRNNWNKEIKKLILKVLTVDILIEWLGFQHKSFQLRYKFYDFKIATYIEMTTIFEIAIWYSEYPKPWNRKTIFQLKKWNW